ncbi:unnamed protein product [Vitrella brassicaformis CCMP3155]|uniref:Uncharacterized protein n=1 Tax=Vitrella brassicaformis (strain CCMP3155) TaxID=1169540 RepID=A0A0G4EU21_VITBC|nr:unnamed protein product [Vitrella brassicaformis CCMP3155]|eukprot:CEM02133.1 unnamed protein product [Vitrella brassicaformis CCMP3155]
MSAANALKAEETPEECRESLGPYAAKMPTNARDQKEQLLEVGDKRSTTGPADGGDGDEGPPVPRGWKSHKNGVEVRVPPGTSDASSQLILAILRRTITHPQHMTQLIQQADPNAQPRLHVEGTTTTPTTRFKHYPLLSLSIDNLSDNSVPTIWAAKGDNASAPVAIPKWQTPGLQLAIMRILIERGADINAGLGSPIRVAIASCKRTAFDLLMSQLGIQLRGRQVLDLPETLPTDQPTEAHEAILLSFYQQLIQRDSTLATERRADGNNYLHVAAADRTLPFVCSQQFIENYIGLLVANGADIAGVDNDLRVTPLHHAALRGSHRLAASLCRRLAAADVNRGPPNDPSFTPLTISARCLYGVTQTLQDNNTGQAVRDRANIRIPQWKATIRTLLRAGADIALMPMATEGQRQQRQWVLAECTTVLNELGDAVMAAINDALAPQRSLAALLAHCHTG